MRIGQAHQVGAGRAQRKKQLDGVFRPRHIERIKGQHIILVDDVLTTGATLESAARTLRRAGAAQVDAWVFAKA
jgi:predicted amidophosphoribosyltransferase